MTELYHYGTGKITDEKPGDALKQIRQTLDNYTLGQKVYPEFAVITPRKELPRKVRLAARLMARTWSGIREDDARFFEALEVTKSTMVQAPIETGSGLVVSRRGLNAINFGAIALEAGSINSAHGVINGRQEKEDFLNVLSAELEDLGSVVAAENKFRAGYPPPVLIPARPDIAVGFIATINRLPKTN